MKETLILENTEAGDEITSNIEKTAKKVEAQSTAREEYDPLSGESFKDFEKRINDEEQKENNTRSLSKDLIIARSNIAIFNRLSKEYKSKTLSIDEAEQIRDAEKEAKKAEEFIQKYQTGSHLTGIWDTRGNKIDPNSKKKTQKIDNGPFKEALGMTPTEEKEEKIIARDDRYINPLARGNGTKRKNEDVKKYTGSKSDK